jgi:hypothetical protein
MKKPQETDLDELTALSDKMYRVLSDVKARMGEFGVVHQELIDVMKEYHIWKSQH